MVSQTEFDHLRRKCATALEQFITQARESQRQIENVTLPVSPEENQQLLTQRSAELDAGELYLQAVRQLAAFLQQQVRFVQ